MCTDVLRLRVMYVRNFSQFSGVSICLSLSECHILLHSELARYFHVLREFVVCGRVYVSVCVSACTYVCACVYVCDAYMGAVFRGGEVPMGATISRLVRIIGLFCKRDL